MAALWTGGRDSQPSGKGRRQHRQGFGRELYSPCCWKEGARGGEEEGGGLPFLSGGRSPRRKCLPSQLQYPR